MSIEVSNSNKDKQVSLYNVLSLTGQIMNETLPSFKKYNYQTEVLYSHGI